MIAASGFKRLGVALVAVFAAGLALLGIISLLTSADTVREAVKSEIRAVTGIDPALRGAVSLSLFPSGTVTFADVVLDNSGDGSAAVTAERVIAKLQFFPLLLGRIQVADVTLVRPTIAVVLEPGGRSNWTSLASTLSAALRPSENRRNSFSEIGIEDGTIIVRDHARGVDERLTKVTGSLAWPSIFQSFAATGRFVWRDEPVEATVSVSDFVAALAGNTSGAKLRLTAPRLKVAFDGHFSTRPTLKLEGITAADAVSLRDAFRWAGQKQLPGGGFGRFALKAKTNLIGSTLTLSGLNIEIDGNAAEGVLTVTTDGRQALQGTLAADVINLTPYISTVRLLADSEREWNTSPIVLGGLSELDFDLRLSAARVKIADATLGRTAIAANLRGGKLAVTVGEAQAFGGIVKGAFTLAASDGGADVRSQMQFKEVDLDSSLGTLLGLRRLEGKGDLAFNVEGSGSSILGITQTLRGTAAVSGQQGAVTGVNVEQLLRRLERRPLSGAGDFRTGRTPYEKLTINLSINQGTVAADDVRVEGSAVRLALAGSASIPSRDLDFTGTAQLTAAASDAGSAFELPFMVRGSWEEPLMLLDTQSLIRRVPAAAPLLDALRDRRARDAVRSAIDRLVGSPPVSATAKPPEP